MDLINMDSVVINSNPIPIYLGSDRSKPVGEALLSVYTNGISMSIINSTSELDAILTDEHACFSVGPFIAQSEALNDDLSDLSLDQ